MIITTYIDESGTHDDSPHMTLGGWVGKWGQWENFDPKWKALLKKNGLTYFHSKEMKGGANEFRGWTDAQKQKFMHDAATIAEKHTLFGFTILLNKDEYRDVYRAGHTSQDLPLDSQYGICFRACLSAIPYLVIDALPKQKNRNLYFVLENGHPNFGDAARIFDLVQKKGPPEVASILEMISGGDKKKFPGLQVADVNAYSAFIYEVTKPFEPIVLPDENAWEVAKKISRVPVFRLTVTPKQLGEFKGFILSKYERRMQNRAAKKAAATA